MDKYIPLTVAIPTYKRCKDVVSLVGAILPQLHEEDELLVVDDGSQDETAQCLESIKRIRLISNLSNQGMVKTWNKCLTSASNEWICFVHDDDTIAPEALKTIRKACSLISEPALIAHHSLDVDLDSCFRYRVVEPGAWAVQHSTLVPSGVTIHKYIIDSIGLFDEQFTYSPDIEYFARICSKFTSIRIESPHVLSFNLHNENYEYKTWCKPDFFTQLEKIEMLVGTYSGLSQDAVLRYFNYRMNQHIKHMLQYSSRADDKTLLQKVSLIIRSKPYLWRRNRVNTQVAALLNWSPNF